MIIIKDVQFGINYKDISINEIKIIKEIWEKNRAYHEKISKNLKDYYAQMNFEDRINEFALFNKEQIKITIAEDTVNAKIVGYCISLFEKNIGEIHTLHVLESARGIGIGKELISKHIQWLRNNQCESIKLLVAYENVNTIRFYESIGFKPNNIEMIMKK